MKEHFSFRWKMYEKFQTFQDHNAPLLGITIVGRKIKLHVIFHGKNFRALKNIGKKTMPI